MQKNQHSFSALFEGERRREYWHTLKNAVNDVSARMDQ